MVCIHFNAHIIPGNILIEYSTTIKVPLMNTDTLISPFTFRLICSNTFRNNIRSYWHIKLTYIICQKVILR